MRQIGDPKQQPPHIGGMQSIHILVGTNGVDNGLFL